MMPPCPGKRLETGNHDLLIAKGGGETKICPPWCIFFSFPSFLHSFLSFLLSLFLSAAVAFHMSGKTCLRNKKLITAPSCHHLVFFFRNMLVKVYWLSTWFGVFVFYFAYIYLLMHTRETYVPTQPLQICQHAMNGKSCTQLFQSIQTIVSAPQRDCCIFKLSSSSGVDSQNFECSTVAWDVS